MFKKRLFSLIINLLILPQIALADSLPERIDRFTELFDYHSAVKSYDIRDMQSTFPTRLLSPESMQPQTASYPLKDIQQLYQLSKTCNGKLPLSPLI
ncbi:DUF3404 domain-containing protein, partial [Vibrio parahaemolyticus]